MSTQITGATEVVVTPRSQPLLSQDAQESIDGFRAIKFAAALFSRSGCFADIKGGDEEQQIAKACVKIAIGRDYGFSAAESMQYIELIQGRPSIAAHARAAKMKAAGYNWKFLKFDEKTCHIDVFDGKGERLGDSSFSMEDARRMGLESKDNWKKNPRNMLYCRAISNAQRWYAPEVLSAALVSTEELMDQPQGAYSHAPIAASISLDQIKPSADPNRGHDKTNPDNKPEKSKATPDLQYLGKEGDLHVYDRLPPKEGLMPGERVIVRTGKTQELFAYDEPSNEFMRVLG